MTLRQEKAIAALIRSPTVEAAAKAAGVGYSTLRRWLKEDMVFQAAYRRATAELLADASMQSKQNLARALSVLNDIMQRSDSDAVRVQAARASLEYSLRLHEAVDASERMQKIEEALTKEDT